MCISFQQNVIRNAYNLLKPGGVLYIGIENKYGLKYLLGEKDDHSGLENFVYLNVWVVGLDMRKDSHRIDFDSVREFSRAELIYNLDYQTHHQKRSLGAASCTS